MFQSYLLCSNNSYYSIPRKGGFEKVMKYFIQRGFSEGEGAAAISSGALENTNEGFLDLIHRVPSIEGATATSSGNSTLFKKGIILNEKKLQMIYSLF